MSCLTATIDLEMRSYHNIRRSRIHNYKLITKRSYKLKHKIPRTEVRGIFASLIFLVNAFHADTDQNHDRQQDGDVDDNAHAHDGGDDFLLPFDSSFNLYYKTIAIISLLGVGGMLIY